MSEVRPVPPRTPLPWILGLALALGLVRFWRLGEWGLWIDEAFTLQDVRRGLDGGGWPIHFLGYGLEALVLQGWGEADGLGLRLAPAILGWLCLPTFYWAVRPWAGAWVSSVATLLLALSTWHVYWSQNARFYTLAAWLALLGTGCLLRGLLPRREGPPRARAAFAGWFLIALGALAHPSAMLLGLACVAGAFWIGRQPGSAAKLERTAVWIALIAAATLAVASPWWLEAWRNYAANKGSPNPTHFVLTLGYHLSPWLGACALWGAWCAGRERIDFSRFALAVAVVTTAAALTAALAVRVTAQYVFVALPWFALLAATALERWKRRRPRSAVLATLMLVGLGAADLAHYFLARHGDRERWREAYAFVVEQRQGEDLIYGMAAPVGEFYLAPDSPSLRQPLEVVPLTSHNAFVPALWARHRRPIWFVINDEWLQDWSAADREVLTTYLREECELRAEFPVPHPARDLDVRVWRTRAGP